MVESEEGNFKNAKRYLLESLNEFGELHALQHKLQAQKSLARVYGQMGELKNAIELTNQYFYLEDSLQKVPINLSVLHKEIAFESEEIGRLKEIQIQQEGELKKRSTQIKIIIGITTVIMALSVLLFQSRKRARLMNYNLASTNEELQATEEELRSNLNHVNELQESLKVKEQLYRELVEEASDVIYEIDENGKFTYVNGVAEKLTGYAKEEILSMHFWEVVHPEKREEVTKDLINLMKQSVDTAYRELPVLTKKHTKIWIGQNIKFQYKNKWLVKARVVARDITEIKDAQQKQRAEHDLLRTIIDVIPINIYVKDIESRKVLINRSELEYLGAKHESEIIGKTDFDLYPEQTASISKNEDLKVLAGQPIIGAETLNIRNDGRHYWFLISKVPLRNEAGDISGIVGISIDITEKKLSLEALMFKASPVPLALKNPRTGLFIEVNESFVNLIGASSKSQLVGHTSLELSIYESGERDKIMNQYRLDKPLEIEEVHMRKIKGEPFVAKVSGHPFNYQDEHYLLLYYIDITQRIESELKLQSINQELSAIFNSTHVSIICTDLNGVITNFSKGAEALLQYKAEEMIGIHTPAIIHVEDEVIARGRELTAQLGREVAGFDVFAEFPRQGKFESREWTYVRKDGSTFPVQLVATALRNEKGEIKGFIGVATDLTERKEAEATLRKYENLQTRNKELEQFNYIASHDLQEPLRTLTSLVEIVNSDYKTHLDQNGIQIFQYISEATSRMQALVKDLLDYSRLSQAGESKPVELNHLLEAVLTDLNSSIQKSNAKMIIGVLPEVDGYETPLRLLFQNLLSNAIKFARKGKKPTIIVGAEKIKKTGKWLFYVQDDGIGIDPKHFEKIFIVFKRLNNRDEFPGTGIGLAQCKKIVEMHGGIIWVESAEGEGSKFCFTLG